MLKCITGNTSADADTDADQDADADVDEDVILRIYMDFSICALSNIFASSNRVERVTEIDT